MISFIIIGRNEGWKLTKCFESVLKTIEFNKLVLYEIIYVDSNSEDDSIIRAKQFKEIKIFKLTSDYNSAIARNIGAEKSKGEVLFFIDGDMEIIPEFLGLVYKKKDGLLSPFISGKFINYYYTNKFKLIIKEKYIKNSADKNECVTGGLFFVTRKIWLSVAGMQKNFRISQDIDFAFRLSKKKIFLLRKKEVAAIHHTIAYKEKKRMWQEFFNGNHLYARSLLYRKHLFNICSYKRLLRNDYTLLFLIFLIIVFIIMDNVFFISPYFLLIIIKAIKTKKRSFLYSINLFSFFLLRDITTFLGFFLFWPSNDFNITYKEL